MTLQAAPVMAILQNPGANNVDRADREKRSASMSPGFQHARFPRPNAMEIVIIAAFCEMMNENGNRSSRSRCVQ
jgi:hypothetical protein